MAWAQVEIEGECQRLKMGLVPGLAREMLLGHDWVGTHKLLQLKEGLQGEWEEQKKGNDFLEKTS